jgi:hypothetical protein
MYIYHIVTFDIPYPCFLFPLLNKFWQDFHVIKLKEYWNLLQFREDVHEKNWHGAVQQSADSSYASWS